MDSVRAVYRKPPGVLFDPDGLITGAELEQGFTFWNSKRVYRDQEHYNQAVGGYIAVDDIPAECPRIFHHIAPEDTQSYLIRDQFNTGG